MPIWSICETGAVYSRLLGGELGELLNGRRVTACASCPKNELVAAWMYAWIMRLCDGNTYRWSDRLLLIWCTPGKQPAGKWRTATQPCQRHLLPAHTEGTWLNISTARYANLSTEHVFAVVLLIMKSMRLDGDVYAMKSHVTGARGTSFKQSIIAVKQ